MVEAEQHKQTVCIFGASGGIGAAMVRLLAAEPGIGSIYAGSRSGKVLRHPKITGFSFDLLRERSIMEAAAMMKQQPPELVIIATGALTLEDGTGPEKSYRALDAQAMGEIMALNTIGPALIAKHMLPVVPRDRRAILAALSARVGSISDNRLGGWHSYRASKAALNMLIRNFAIEMGRSHKQAIIAGLHPGTVDTALSEMFQGNVADGKLFTPEYAAERLLAVLDGLTPQDSGSVFGWDGKRVQE
ncbi:SDR family NAD(P)-dependent oxidoreductase [Altererythrobacter aquiaggeris]|uniref:SDR family NAD(P)-dependent oxidoreductase n=1 Tax=Aestuarierythrobacter aquiaggeris TaxID=1898396 RepID=UPI003016B0E0